MLLVSALLVGACSVMEDLGPTVELGPTVKVPASRVRPVDTCLHDAGFIATAFHEGTSRSNEKYGYSWETPTYFTWETPADGFRASAAAALRCRSVFDPYQGLTDDEISATYERWTKERLCLMDLGFTVPQPPPLEEFKRTWTTGPWTPGDAIRNPSQAAHDACGLEMLE